MRVNLTRFRPIVPWALLALITMAALIVQSGLGRGLYDVDGNTSVKDFLMQWGAARRAIEGQPALVYDWKVHSAYQAQLLGITEPVRLSFMYPPHFLFFVFPFGYLGYVAASVCFLAATLAAYVLALRLITGSILMAALVALAGAGTFYSLLWIQNGLLMAALLVGGIALLPSRPILAGILFGLLTVKPQLGLLLPLVLLIDRRWATIGAAIATTLLLAFLSELAFGPGIWKAAFASVSQSPTLLVSDNLRFKFQSIYAFARIFLEPGLAFSLHLFAALYVAGLVTWMWSRQGPYSAKAAALIAGTLLLSPYLFVYDAVPLSAAAILLSMDSDEGPDLTTAEQLVLLGSLLLPMLSTNLLFSASVPLTALVTLLLALRSINRSGAHQSSPEPQGQPIHSAG